MTPDREISADNLEHLAVSAEPVTENTDDLSAQLNTLTHPGTQLSAILNIEHDLQTKPLPKGSQVLEISSPAKNPQQTYDQLKKAIKAQNGFLLNLLFSKNGELRVLCVVPNATAMHNLATSLSQQSTTLHRPNIKQLATYKGFIIPISDEPKKDQKIPDSLDAASVTEQSIKHAKTLKGPQPEITSGVTVIKAVLPSKTSARTLHEAVSFADAVEKPTRSVFEMTKTGDNYEVTILVDGERSHGNTGRRLSKLLDLIDTRKVALYLDADKCKLVEVAPGVFAMQMDELFQLPSSEFGIDPGVFETKRFTSARRNERDEAVAKWETAKTGKACDRVVRINPVDFEAVTGGPDKMIGRDQEFKPVSEKIAALHNKKTSSVLILEGDRGIGKTLFIKEIIKETKTQGISSVYYKVAEDGKTTSGTAVKKLIEGMLLENPELREEFCDLGFYATGTIPEGLRSEYGLTVQQLHNENFLKRRFIAFVQAASKTKPLVLALDDLQWTDDFSAEIFAQLVTAIEGNSNILLTLASRKDEEMPIGIKNAAQSKPDYIRSNLKLEKLDSDKYLKDYIESYLEANLTGYPKSTNAVRETFVEEMKQCQGHPLVINGVLALLIEKGDIKYEDDQLKIQHGAASELLTSGDVGELVASVTQARFGILSPEARKIADWLVITGDMDMDLFEQVLKNSGEDEETTSRALQELYRKGITIRGRANFSHDSMREERRKQMAGREAQTATMAAKAYEELIKLKEQFPEINNVRLFQLLHNALERPDVLDGEQRTSFSDAYLRIGQNALEDCLDSHDNPQVVQIAKLIEERTRQSFNRAIRGENEPAKIALSRYLAILYVKTAEAYNRRGQLDDAKTYLGKIDSLGNSVPSAGLRAGEDALPYFLMQLDIAYNELRLLAKSPDKKNQQMNICNQRKGELLATISTIQPPTPQSHLAKIDCDITTMKILTESNVLGNIGEIRRIASEALSELSKLEKQARAQKDESLLRNTRRRRCDIERSDGQIRFIKAKASLKGVDGEAKIAQQLNPGTAEYAELAELEDQLTRVREAYSHDHTLVSQPQYVPFVDYSLAVIQWLTGRAGISRDTAREGVRRATNLGASDALAMICSFMGDTTVYSVLSKDFRNPDKWPEEALNQALTDYKTGLNEVDNKTAIWRNLALNRGRAVAMLALARSTQEKPTEDLKPDLIKAWNDTFKTLAHYKQTRASNFIDELKIAGMLLEACLKSGISFSELEMSKEITRDDIRQASQQSTAPSHSDAIPSDQWFTSLRNRGAMALSMNWILPPS